MRIWARMLTPPKPWCPWEFTATVWSAIPITGDVLLARGRKYIFLLQRGGEAEQETADKDKKLLSTETLPGIVDNHG